MVSEKKTLIIYDTNTLRSTREGDVTYCTFEFGSTHQQIESFVLENGLVDFVKTAVPRIVIEELKKQKADRYSSDIIALSQIHSRLSLMPHVDPSTIRLPRNDFDCQKYVGQLAQKYLAERKIQIIELPTTDDKLKDFFQTIVTRALKMQPPFRQSNRYSDIGFKDALIWESILHFDAIKDFDKVILMTGDAGLSSDECKREFEDKTKRYISFQQSADFVVEELNSDYEEYIRNYQFMAFARSEYFKSYLTEQLSEKKYIITDDGQKYEISRFEILNSCENVEADQVYPGEEETETEGRTISSKIEIILVKEGNEQEIIVNARTFVDEDRNISSIEFDKELTDA